MKRVVLTAMLFLSLSASIVLASGTKSTQDEMPSDTMQTEQPIEVGNKICPVSHEEFGKDGMAPHEVTYKGKVYNLCCSMCEKDFNKDPERYSKMLDEEAAASNKQAIVYTCSMHPEVRKATPGNCPKCGMALKLSK